MDPAEFVAARLREDEEAARAAMVDTSPRTWTAIEWRQGTQKAPGWDQDTVYAVRPGTQPDPSESVVVSSGPAGSDTARHIARQDPAATLARVEALRALVADIEAERHVVIEDDCWYTCAVATDARDGGSTCREDPPETCDCGRDWRVARRLRHVAAIWRDHEDYDAERWGL